MKQLFEPKTIVRNLLGTQKIRPESKYRPVFYHKCVKINEGILIINLLTYELIFLENDEAKYFSSENNNFISEVTKELIEKWFLVPVENDDLKLLKQIETLLKLSNKSYNKNIYSTFTILPTTDCNARCFYCFENGSAKKTMDVQTANDVADFILNKRRDGKIFLRWFGGEPLYNSDAINIICGKLSDNGVEYESTMISNGYLFDSEMVEKAKKLWKLTRVQITLDGTEEKYNRIKNYIYKSGNPFLRVLDNIKLLLESDISVRIRMNLDQYNIDDIYNLTDKLFDCFKGYEKLRIYSALIFEESCAHMKNVDAETRKELLNKQINLEKYILENGKYAIDTKIHKNRFGHCMADDNYSVMILPDGSLGKCQSFVDSNFIGSIYSDKLDSKMLNWYSEIKTISKDCDDCIFRMACVYPKCCIMSLQNCTDLDKKIIENRLEDQMIKCYSESV